MYTQQQPESIREMFGAIASRYDTTNKVISFGLHGKWNHLLREEIDKYRIETLLDLCCGTGDTSLPFLAQRKEAKGILLDFCPEMIALAKEKSRLWGIGEERVTFLVGDAQHLPLPAASVDAVTIAYGIRNVKQPEMVAAETFRVLKGGGIFAILELTRPKSNFLRVVHILYLKALLPLLGGATSKNRQAYSYLGRSISSFLCPHTLERVLQNVGFQKTWQRPLLHGAATLIFGRKN